MALVNVIPNQYAQENVAYNYTFPADTFSGAGLVYSAYLNRKTKGRKLPSWLTFTAATRTFSGTPTKWWELKTLQVVVEADEAGVKSYCIFILTIGAADNVGRPVWRSGSVPDHALSEANIGSFNPATINPGDWVTIATDITRNTVPSGYLTIIQGIRDAGGFIVWMWNNHNGLKAHLQNYFDFDLVQAGETIAIDFSAGNTRGFLPYGRLWRGLRGKEIYVTNYAAPGTITARNFQDLQSVNAIAFHRASATMQDRFIRVIGQPNGHVPFVNLHGITLSEGNLFAVDGSQGDIEAAYLNMLPGTIGFHWKPNTTINWGDRRASENLNGYDLNQKYLQIHDCVSLGGSKEVIYLGGGGWNGQDVNVLHYNPDGSAKMVTHNGQQVHDYHIIRRFNAVHEYVSIEYNDFREAGWDAIQVRCAIREVRVMYNFLDEMAKSNDVNTSQCEGIMQDGAMGEVAYNFIRKPYMAGLRTGMLGWDNVHHNIVVDSGQDNWGMDAQLPLDFGGFGYYCNDRGNLAQDYPQVFINNYGTWSAATNYDYDNFQHPVKVKLNGKSYRSIQTGNLNHNPETEPLWWEDTREWVSAIMRPDLVAADLFHHNFHNTYINCKGGAGKFFLTHQECVIKNNLAVNCGAIPFQTGGAVASNNLDLDGVVLADFFEDPVNHDYRLKVGSAAIGAGIDISAYIDANYHDGFNDYSAGAHDAPPSCGAFEDGAVVGDHFSWVKYGQAGAPSNPPPITLNVGGARNINLPTNSVVVEAVKSDPARVLNSILWTQLSGPSIAGIANGGTLIATFTALQVGSYVFKIATTDEFGQNASAEVTVNVAPEGIVTRSTFQWYIADDNGAGTGPNLATQTPIANSNVKALVAAPYVGQGKWFARGERPVAKSGILIGQESLSNWVRIV